MKNIDIFFFFKMKSMEMNLKKNDGMKIQWLVGFVRANTLQERLNSVKKIANFEIAPLFSRHVRSWVKKHGRFKIGNFFT